MDRMFDEMARILASQMPRRQAFKLLGGALVGGIVAALRTETVSAACSGTQTACGTGCCNNSNQQCCGTSATGFSCQPKTNTCCGKNSCSSTNQRCCGTGTAATCRASTDNCCGTTGLSCKSGVACCTNCTNKAPFCVTPKKTCPIHTQTC
jgi:hypothetical protein